MAHVVLVDGSDMDIVSFDDSEQFEDEDSVCSWISDTQQTLNWSGWKSSSQNLQDEYNQDSSCQPRKVLSLIERCAKCVARNYAFEIVENYQPPIPESLQLRIAFWSFPGKEDEIRLYSCLASGSNDKFKLGEILVKSGNVRDVLQIGFHLSGVVTQPVSHTPAKEVYNVAISFDRGHITSCQCSCNDNITWCEHATAVCLYRIVNSDQVSLRAPVSESLTRLQRDQLQKFAQYLISELPQQILPTAQRLLDELLSSKDSQINVVDGAPDPTAGASISEEAKWVLDELSLRDNIKKILGRFCGVLPMVLVDVNSAFLTSAPPVSLEWSSFIRSFQSHDPEAIWNLLSIVRHMFASGDSNASLLLEYVTEECILCYQMMYYWLCSYHDNLQGTNSHRYRQENFHTTKDMSRHTSSHLMEEIVHLWELASMTPYLNETEKVKLKSKFHLWTAQVIDAAKKGRGQGALPTHQARLYNEFSGFNVAINACSINWNMYYQMLSVSEGCAVNMFTDGISVKERSICSNNTLHPDTERLYNEIITVLPTDMNEFTLTNKLIQGLSCHGCTNKASMLASLLAKKIITSFPDRLTSGEVNFAWLVEKANYLCDLLMVSAENEKLAFEIAILGLTVPRLPAQSSIEEVRMSYLEMSLYGKLKNILITDERLIFLRYQSQKFLANPMLRGDTILPLLMTTYLFEVLCRKNINSTVLPKRELDIKFACKSTAEDIVEGYKCALVSLGLSSNAADQKQPMLCESIRHHRRDLALALLLHSRSDESQMEEVLAVILDKERYSFMGNATTQTNNNTGTWLNAQETKKRKKKVISEDDVGSGKSKPAFTFVDFYAANNQNKNNTSSGGSSNVSGTSSKAHQAPVLHPPVPRHSSDSDSGHGEGGHEKRFAARNLPVPITTNRKQQRRQARQNVGKNRNDKTSSRNSDRPWAKHSKVTRPRKSSKSKITREMTESDSGQEMMHFSFEGESKWTSQTENWDDEIESNVVTINNKEEGGFHLENNLSTTATRQQQDGSTSGEGSSVGSMENIPNENTEQVNAVVSNSYPVSAPTELSIPLIASVPNVLDNQIPLIPSVPIVLDNQIPLLPAVPNDVVNDDNQIDDAGFEEDFNIEPDLFQRTTNSNEHQENNVQVLSPLLRYQTAPTVVDSESLIDETAASINQLDLVDEANGVVSNLYGKQMMISSDYHRDIDTMNNQNNLVQDEKPQQYDGDKHSQLNDGDIEKQQYVGDKHSQLNDRDIEKQQYIGDVKPKLDGGDIKEQQNEVDEKPEFDCDDEISVDDNVITQRAEQIILEDERLLMENKHQSSCESLSNPSDDVNNDESSMSNPSDDVINSQSSISRSSSLDSGADQTTCSSKQNKSNGKNKKNKKKQMFDVETLQSALQSIHVPPAIDYTSSNHTSSSSSSSQQTSRQSWNNQDNTTTTPRSSKQQKTKKNKQKKNKKNKPKVAMNVHSIEAEAYSLFELAKSVLLQARNTGMFSADVDEVSISNTMNRRLQLAAFEIGLFALNMHNYSSPNWFSRTYSTYVKWIETQAIDIGTAALRVLNERWEGILTPSESIQIATRASRSGDSLLKRTAAELALSCLCYSQSLSPGDIMQTITMCREQTNEMLERACSAVENAGRNGGVQPELFFRIAREWHYLHEQTRHQGEEANATNSRPRGSRSPPTLNNRGNSSNLTKRDENGSPLYLTPEQFVQEQMHQQAQEMLGRPLPRNANPDQFAWIYPPFYGASLHHCPLPQQAIHSRRLQNFDTYNLPYPIPDELNLSDIPRYLQNAYRVGMRALEALKSRMPADRPDVKYAIAPPSSQDIRWMCALAASLGSPYLKNFCKVVYHAVTSPYLLHDLALEAARHFASFNPAQLASYLRSPSVSPIVQKTLTMYSEHVHHELVLLTTPGYNDFVELLRRVRSAFCMAPGGMARFNEILEFVRKTHPKKRELWQLIMNGLSKA